MMATSDDSHPSHRVENQRGDESVHVPDDEGTQTGGASALGGRIILGGVVLFAVLWVVAMIQILRVPPEVSTTTMRTAVWTGLAITAGFGSFLMGIWKAHRT